VKGKCPRPLDDGGNISIHIIYLIIILAVNAKKKIVQFF